jgi:hypothetical protein
MSSSDSFLFVSAHISSPRLYRCNTVLSYYNKYIASWPCCVITRVCDTANDCCWLCAVGGLVVWNSQTAMHLVEPLFEVPLPCLITRSHSSCGSSGLHGACEKVYIYWVGARIEAWRQATGLLQCRTWALTSGSVRCYTDLSSGPTKRSLSEILLTAEEAKG